MQKNMISFLFFILFSIGLSAAPIVLKSTNNELIFKLDISKKYSWEKKIIGNKNFDKLRIKDDDFATAGNFPEVLSFERSLFFAVDNENTKPEIAIISKQVLDISHKNLIAAPKYIMDKNGVINEQYFSPQKIIKAKRNMIKLEDEGIINDYHLYRVIFNPLQFDNNLQQLVTSLTIKINYNGHIGKSQQLKKNASKSVFEKMLLNNNIVAKTKYRSRKNTGHTFLETKGKWVKIKIKNGGIYKITGQMLTDAGVDISAVQTNRIAVYSSAGEDLELNPPAIEDIYLGALPIARRIVDINNNEKTIGSFISSDGVVFYAKNNIGLQRKELDHYYNKFSDYTYYWIDLGLNSDLTGVKIMENANSTMSVDSTMSTFYKPIVFENRNELYYNTGGETAYWFTKEIPHSQKVIYDFEVGDVGSDDFLLTPHFYNLNYGDIKYNINNNTQFEFSNNSLEFTKLLPSSILKPNQTNTLNLTNLSTHDSRYFLGYNIFYKGEIDCSSNKNSYVFGFMANSKTYKLDFQNANGKDVYDISDPFNVKYSNITNNSINTSALDNLAHYYFIKSANTYLTPENISIIDNNSQTALTEYSGSYDMIIISPNIFYNYLKDESNLIKTHIEAGDISSGMVVNIEDINNQFGRGYQEPSATRNFIKYAHENWGTDYILLAGDGTYDTKDIFGYSVKNLISPSKSDDNRRGSDDFYANLESIGAGIQHIAIGRFTADNLSELQNMVEKTTEYIKNPTLSKWRSTILLAGDDEYVPPEGGSGADWTQTYHIGYLESKIVPVLPASYIVKKLYLTEYPFETSPSYSSYVKPKANADLVRELNNGVNFWVYSGHGSPSLLAHERLFTAASNSKINNIGKYFFMFGATCSFGVFDTPNSRGLSEIMLAEKKNGSIGLINSTRGCGASGNTTLLQKFIQYFFKTYTERRSIGEAFKLAKTSCSGSNTAGFMLIGDPALHIFRDSEVVEGENVDQLHTLKLDSITSSIPSDYTSIGNGGTINTIVVDAPRDIVYKNPEHNVTMSYTLPGNVILSALSSIKNRMATAKFILPKDLNYGENGGKVIFYGYDENKKEITGNIESINIIGGESENDITPPEITVKFNDLNYKKGDPIGKNPMVFIELQDENGLNTSGSAGHAINIEHKSIATDITNYFTYFKDSYKKGYTYYQLLDLSPGKNNIKISAWDSYNNYNEKNIEFEVIDDSSPIDNYIGNLLPYPNPMKQNGSTFTFSAHNTQSLSSYKITVYTINGRKVKIINSLSINSSILQSIFWNGRDEDGDFLGNGVYLYKVEANYGGKVVRKIGKLLVNR